MNIFKWLTGSFSPRGKALAMYRRGMAEANREHHQRAIELYTQAIEVPGAPADVKAMALFNRALTHSAAKDDAHAEEDLNAILAMVEPLEGVKTEARRKLLRMDRRSHKDSM